MMKTLTGLLKGMVPSTVASGVGRPSLLSLHPSFERDEVVEEEEELYASRRRTSI